MCHPSLIISSKFNGSIVKESNWLTIVGRSAKGLPSHVVKRGSQMLSFRLAVQETVEVFEWKDKPARDAIQQRSRDTAVSPRHEQPQVLTDEDQ